MLFDLRLAFRSLAKTPGFTFIAIITLTVGIGLNVSMFSLVNSLLLQPLPFPQSERLIKLHRATPQNSRGGFAPADYLDLKRAEAPFGQFAGYTNTDVALSEPGQPAELHGLLRVTTDFFAVLQVQPVLGRTFRTDEESAGNQHVVILSYDLWQKRYGGAANILGRTIRIDSEPHKIIGVMPSSVTSRKPFAYVDLFRPLGLTAADRTARDKFWLSNLIGRRAIGVSAGQAEAFVANFGTRIARDFPSQNPQSSWYAEDLLRSSLAPNGRVVVIMLL